MAEGLSKYILVCLHDLVSILPAYDRIVVRVHSLHSLRTS